jgi:hypothetical protein
MIRVSSHHDMSENSALSKCFAERGAGRATFAIEAARATTLAYFCSDQDAPLDGPWSYLKPAPVLQVKLPIGKKESIPFGLLPGDPSKITDVLVCDMCDCRDGNVMGSKSTPPTFWTRTTRRMSWRRATVTLPLKLQGTSLSLPHRFSTNSPRTTRSKWRGKGPFRRLHNVADLERPCLCASSFATTSGQGATSLGHVPPPR